MPRKILYMTPRIEQDATFMKWDTYQNQMRKHKKRIFDGNYEVDLSDEDELLLFVKNETIVIPIQRIIEYYYGHTAEPIEWSEIQDNYLEYDLTEDDFDLVLRHPGMRRAVLIPLYTLLTTYMREELLAVPNGYEE